MSRDLNFVLLGVATVLLVVLLVSFASRPRVFSQYLRLLTGIRVTPSEIKRVYAERGRAGVRELFLDLLIREDLAEEGVASPDAEPHQPVALELDEERERTASGVHVLPETPPDPD
ncbi:MAG TPA: hypothetical protein VLA66_06600 [Thermoanaerobaculia bacterium]|nr:hypothetical protein [Thermoanaerobaculia bacterium]